MPFGDFLGKVGKLPGSTRPGSPLSYLMAISLIGVATFARLYLYSFFPTAPFITFFPAVILATFLGGVSAGFFSVVLATVCIATIITPVFSSSPPHLVGNISALLAFDVIACLNVAIVGVLLRAISGANRLNDTLRSVFELNPDAVLLVDADGLITAANRRTEELFGWPRTTLTGMPIEQLIPERFRIRHAAHIQAFLDNPHPRAMGIGLELRGCAADGREFPVDVQIGPIAIDGKARAIATVRDLTAQKALAEALEESQRQRVALEERQRVAEELARNEARLKDFVDLSSDWLWEQDADLRLSWVSDTSRHLLSSPSARLGLKRWEYQDTAKDPERWARHRADVEAHRPFHDFVYETVSPDDQVRYSSISGRPIFDDTGKFLGYRGVGHRITERVEAERALREAKERAERAEDLLRDAIDSISEAVLIWDKDDRLIASNEIQREVDPAFRTIFRLGVTFEQAAREAAYSGAVPETAGCEEAWIAERVRQHQAATGAKERILSSGRWERITERRMRGGGIVSLYVDITERKQAELALRETQTRFERAQATAGVGTWEYDVQEGKWYLSKQVYVARGLDPDRHTPNVDGPRPHVHPEDRHLLRDMIDRLQTAPGRASIEERIITPSGETRIHLIEGQAVEDPKTGWKRLVGTLRDVTEQRRMERQLLHATKMEAIGGVTGGMAHDFNNLLGVLVLNLGFVESRLEESSRLRPLISEALNASRRGADLVRSLLAFARRQPLRPARIDVNGVISTLSHLLARVLGENIRITLELGAETWEVIADPAQLEACMMNLAANARDAMPRGGRLTISTSNLTIDAGNPAVPAAMTPGDYAVIVVSDTGVGMTPEVMAKIFEPFFTTKEPGKGTGLGLSMVFGFASQSGGHVTVYSEPGRGTTMRLFLPRAVEPASGIAVPALPRAPIASGGGETILVVEDNEAMRRTVVRELAELNYQVLEASDAAAALAILQAEPVDLILSDVVMPGPMDGIDLASRVLTAWPGVAIVLTSGFLAGQASDRLTGPLASVALLSKPYEPDSLAGTIRMALDSRARTPE